MPTPLTRQNQVSASVSACNCLCLSRHVTVSISVSACHCVCLTVSVSVSLSLSFSLCSSVSLSLCLSLSPSSSLPPSFLCPYLSLPLFHNDLCGQRNPTIVMSRKKKSKRLGLMRSLSMRNKGKMLRPGTSSSCEKTSRVQIFITK